MAKKGCKVPKKVICPRCHTEFVPEEGLLHEHQHEKGKKDQELNVLTSCPQCGNKTRIEF